MRVRTALRFQKPAATNLGFVFISDDSIAALNQGLLGRSYGLYWPRHIYGRLLRELSSQGAEAVAFDVLFGELRPDHQPVPVSTGTSPGITEFLSAMHPGEKPLEYEDQGEKFTQVPSDDYFAWQLKRAGIGILAAERNVLPPPLLGKNALALGDIFAEHDTDGVLRRAKAFRDYRVWNPVIVASASGTAVDLTKARVEPGQILFFDSRDKPVLDESGKQVSITLNREGEFDAREFVTVDLPPGETLWRKPFTTVRVWHMGIVLAAQGLKLDLSNSKIDLEHGQITLRGARGVERVLPVDRDGYLYINWEMTATDPRLTKEAIESLLVQDQKRLAADTATLTNRWRGKLVVVGSSATGNDLTDRGTTPLEKDTLLVSKHWNVANSIITERFVRRASLMTELILVIVLGMVTALLTWQLRVFSAAGGVILLALGYCATGFFLYVQYRYWLPLVLPVGCAMVVEHVSLVTYRVVFEERERRRVKNIFSRIVSPNIVNELLEAENLSLVGARREITILFADVRGFTEFTDNSQEQAAEYVRRHNLGGAATEAFVEEQARETLTTINTYLALVADMVKKHDGTLDKYIGDCVMAFWGAPTPNPKHALACVRAAIDAQRAVHELNLLRAEENRSREAENEARIAAGQTPKPLLPILMLGSGINTGVATVGLMGSESHLQNYTVFGREVNLASRLESLSGRGRIVTSETTCEHLRRDDPALAASCIALPDATVKGIRTAIKIYEIPWRQLVEMPANQGLPTGFLTRKDLGV